MPAYDVTPRPAVRITQFHAVTPNTPRQNALAIVGYYAAWVVGLLMIGLALYSAIK